MKKPCSLFALFSPETRQHVTDIKIVPSSLPEGMLTMPYMLNCSDHFYSTASEVQCFRLMQVLKMRERHTKTLHDFTPWKSTILPCRSFFTLLEWSGGNRRAILWKIWIQSWGSNSVSRKECAEEQCGHGCWYMANPSASFSTASSLPFKWATVHSCVYITLIHSFPSECVYRGYQGASMH